MTPMVWAARIVLRAQQTLNLARGDLEPFLATTGNWPNITKPIPSVKSLVA